MKLSERARREAMALRRDYRHRDPNLGEVDIHIADDNLFGGLAVGWNKVERALHRRAALTSRAHTNREKS